MSSLIRLAAASLRAGTAQGLDNLHLTEGMHLVSSNKLNMAIIRKYEGYTGSTAGSLIGPVIMPPLSEAWSLKWHMKKDVHGAMNLIPVGGKLRQDDDEDEVSEKEKAAQRTKDTVEPVFSHAYPTLCY